MNGLQYNPMTKTGLFECACVGYPTKRYRGCMAFDAKYKYMKAVLGHNHSPKCKTNCELLAISMKTNELLKLITVTTVEPTQRQFD